MVETLTFKRPTTQQPVEETLETLTFKRPTLTDQKGNFYKTVPVSNNSAIDLNGLLEEYNRPLIKEDFLEDERLQELVIQNLETRFRPEAMTYRRASGLAGAAVGGFSGEDYRSRPFEEVFEIWQNYQRSFNVGQSVTVANEIGFTLNKDDETRRKLGAGYLLFDSMDNAITGEGSWSEMADAIWDYGKGVVYDPTTLATLGIGKAMSSGATKVSSALVRQQLVELAKKGITGKMAAGAIKTAPYVATDMALNVGIDIAQQGQFIKTEAQEDYDAMRTGLVAAGSMAIPALVGGVKAMGALRKSKALRDTVVGYTELGEDVLKLPAKEATEKVYERTNVDLINGVIDDNFGKIKGDPESFLKWEQAKVVAGDILDEKGERLTDDQLKNAFEKYFLFGNPDEKNSQGFYTALKDAGFVITPSMKEENTISGIYGQAITMLSDDVVEKSIKTFEEATGRKLGLDYTADGLSAHFVNRATEAGRALGIRGQLSRLERAGLTGRELAEQATATGEKAADPKRMQFALSVYKRLLTSHLATTGANLKGFTQLVSLNTYADLFSSATYASQSAFYKLVKGDADKALMYGNKAYASFMTPLRRGVGVLSPDLDIEYANRVLDANPEMMEKLFRDISGDGGHREALSQLNIDPNNLFYKGVDSVTKGAQTATMVRMQDELTKRWAFAANLDRSIMRAYGTNAAKFWKREDAALEMASDKFQNLMDEAIFRTLRETASVNWSTLPGKNAMRRIARAVEGFTNRSAGGFIVPFGSFMNTTIATLGDLSGINALRYSMGRVLGRPVNYVDQDFGELMGKAAAGWTTVAFLVPEALGKIQSGLAYNQAPTESGDVEDRRYDWPESTIRLVSQMIGHSIVGKADSEEGVSGLIKSVAEGEVEFRWEQIPEDLWTEFAAQAGPGQAVRDLDEAVQGVVELMKSVRDDPASSNVLEDMLAPLLARPVQGITRPLDPINVVAGIARDGNMNPDLKQGPEAINQAFRYINQILPEAGYDAVSFLTRTDVPSPSELPRKADPLRGARGRVDLGRQVLGNRTTAYPNIAESMFNSAGIPSWKAVRWTGPEKIKNTMDGIAAPIFEREAILALKQHPDFFKLPTPRKIKILDGVKKKVREKVLDVIDTRGIPRVMDAARLVAGQDKEKVKDVMERLGYEGSIDDILKDEDALDKLEKIKYFVDNYDSIFYGDLK